MQPTGDCNCWIDVGASSEDQFADDAVLLADCFPWVRESYDTFAVDGKKLESRDKQPYGLGRFIRDAQQNIELFCLCYGAGRKPERLSALDVMGRLREYHPDLFTAQTLVQTWEAANFRYAEEVKDGTRRLVRMRPDSMESGL